MNPQLVGVPHASGQPNDGGMTTVEQNKAIIREFIDRLFTKGDLGAVDDLLAEDSWLRSPTTTHPTRPSCPWLSTRQRPG
jgi:hypothetical protein